MFFADIDGIEAVLIKEINIVLEPAQKNIQVQNLMFAQQVHKQEEEREQLEIKQERMKPNIHPPKISEG